MSDSLTASPLITGEISARRLLWLRYAPMAISLLSLVLLTASWFIRPYAQDDFFVSYTSWLRSTELQPYSDYYVANFTPLAELLAPLYRAFPDSLLPLDLARGLMLVVAYALVYATFRVARALGGDAPWCWAAVAVLVWQVYFVKRLADVRADQISALFLMLSILALIENRSRWRWEIAGGLFGLAVTATYKVGVAAPFFAVALVLFAGGRNLLPLLRFAGASAVPVAAYFLWRLAEDGTQTFVAIWGDVFGSILFAKSERLAPFFTSLFYSPVPVLFILLGGAGFLTSQAPREIPRRVEAMYVILVPAFIATFVWLNPFIFPYNFVIFMPLLAPFVVGIPKMLPRARSGTVQIALLLALPLAAMSTTALEMGRNFIDTNRAQREVVRWTWAALAPDETAFDWQGIHLYRRGINHWWHYSGLQPKYLAGWYSVEQEMRAAQVSLVLENYRLGWLSPRDKLFFRENFQKIDTCLYVPGWRFTKDELVNGKSFDAFMRQGEYLTLADNLNGVLVDGEQVLARQTMAAGEHTVRLAPGTKPPSYFGMYYVTPRRERPLPCPKDSILPFYN